VAACIEQLGAGMAKPSVKQHLAAIRQLLDSIDVTELSGLAIAPSSASWFTASPA